MLRDRHSFKLRAAILSILTTVLVAGIAVGADDNSLLSKGELKNLIAKAKTAADHERFAGYFDAKAVQLERDGEGGNRLPEKARTSVVTQNPRGKPPGALSEIPPVATRSSRSPSRLSTCRCS